jgi:hypothetical protein
MKIEDVFRKLKPVAAGHLDVLWLEYILAETKSQKDIEDALRIVLARDPGQTFEENEVLLEPAPEELARGESPLGVIFYGHERFHVFVLREEWKLSKL